MREQEMVELKAQMLLMLIVSSCDQILDLRGTVLTFRCVEGPASGIDIGAGRAGTSPLTLLVPDLADPPLFSLI